VWLVELDGQEQRLFLTIVLPDFGDRVIGNPVREAECLIL
jgi:hypothetical protein